MSDIQTNPARSARWSKLTYIAALPALAGLAAATGWAAASIVPVDTPKLSEVREALRVRLPKTPIDAIHCAGLGGLCEVASKATLFYVDRQARYLVIGRVYDMETRQDLTAVRLLALNPDLLASGAARRAGADDVGPASPRRSAPAKVDLVGLPAKGAIGWGPANGPRVVVFSDFHCGFCKRLSEELKAIGARVEERPISILGSDSRKIAEQVICAPRPEMALHAAYSQLALANPKPCDTRGLDANETFAKANGFAGTPVIVRPSDGAVIEGYRSGAELKAWLAAPAASPTKDS